MLCEGLPNATTVSLTKTVCTLRVVTPSSLSKSVAVAQPLKTSTELKLSAKVDLIFNCFIFLLIIMFILFIAFIINVVKFVSYQN